MGTSELKFSVIFYTCIARRRFTEQLLASPKSLKDASSLLNHRKCLHKGEVSLQNIQSFPKILKYLAVIKISIEYFYDAVDKFQDIYFRIFYLPGN